MRLSARSLGLVRALRQITEHHYRRGANVRRTAISEGRSTIALAGCMFKRKTSSRSHVWPHRWGRSARVGSLAVVKRTRRSFALPAGVSGTRGRVR